MNEGVNFSTRAGRIEEIFLRISSEKDSTWQRNHYAGTYTFIFMQFSEGWQEKGLYSGESTTLLRGKPGGILTAHVYAVCAWTCIRRIRRMFLQIIPHLSLPASLVFMGISDDEGRDGRDFTEDKKDVDWRRKCKASGLRNFSIVQVEMVLGAFL